MHPDLSIAETAIGQGDYSRAISLLEPLSKTYPLLTPPGALVRMLMLTALMGQGKDEQAITTCRHLCHCKDPEIRKRAKQLLEVLEAPSLDRPSNWSLRLPNMELTALGISNKKQIKSGYRSRAMEPQSSPPTGPTKDLSAGYSSVVLAVLIGLTLLLNKP